MKKPKSSKPITELIRPTPEEDERINAGIAADPDTCELTLEDIKSMRPTSETHPEIVEAYRRSRGKQKAPTKIATSIRLSETVLEAYKQLGPGWQSKIDQDLQDLVAKRRAKKSVRK
ncbi:MAG: BrnA antitoxin family protein [Halioglobus sp.]|nr:BrnA antitoxin family protein [Halioglobus sp.]